MARKKKKNNPNTRPLGYRQKAVAEQKAKYPYYNLKSNVLGGLFLVGLVLTVWEIYIYRVTFISFYIPLGVWPVTGIIITPIFKRTFNIYCFNPYTPGRTPMVFHYFFNVVSFGGVSVFLFMWTNQTFNDKSKAVLTHPIISYGHLAKSRRNCGEPYVVISYQSEKKELVFPCGTDVENYSSVYVETVKGLFGFDVITDKTLIQGQW
jgi:hypothetical protein